MATEKVYVLQLEHERIYVGTTTNVLERLAEHLQGKGSVWTKQYDVLDVLEVLAGGKDVEKTKTLEYMKKVGWWNVRGAAWTSVDMKRAPNELLLDISVCRNCHCEGHATCNFEFCTRCGRTSHTLERCYANSHV